MYCPKCGSPIDHDHSYCSQCGCSLEHWGMVSDHPPEPPTHHPKRTNPSWFYILVIMAFCLMIWGFYSFIAGADTLSTIARSQLEEIKTNKLTKAYYEHTSADFRKENTLEEFKQFVEKNPALKDYLKVDIVKSEKDKKYGVVFLKLFLPNDLETEVKFEFIEEEGEWRILGVSTEKPKLSDEELEKEESSIVDAVKIHLEAMRKGEIDKAYDMGSKEFMDATQLQAFKDFVKEHPALVTDGAASMSIVEQEGEKALVRVLLYSNGEPTPVDYIMVSEDGIWKVWSFYVLTPDGEGHVEEAEVSTVDLTQPIETFFKDLQNGQIEKAYDQTDKKFQETTSLEQFKDFLKQFPLIREAQATQLKSKVSGNIGQIRYNMVSGSQEAVVDYILTKKGDTWKILGIQLVDDIEPLDEPENQEGNQDFDDSFLTKTITDQLNKIREKDFFTAYEDFTSEKFRKSTPFENFAQFVEQNAVFSLNKSAKFGELTFNNNVATIVVELNSEEGTSEQVEYDLVKEGDDWKILSIKILNPSISSVEPQDKQETEQGLVIEGIDLGTEVNLSGKITNPSTKIKATATEIFANLLIVNGESGTVVEVFFEHLDTGSSLPPVTKTLKETGNSPISLVFTPPKGGWPVGKYLLKAKASSGQEKDLEFEVIE